MAASTTSDGKLVLKLQIVLCSLTGLEPNKIHVHYQHYVTSCDDEASIPGENNGGANLGHYYNSTVQPTDQWTSTTEWGSSSDGDAVDFAEITAATLGFGAESAYDRVAIVHNSDGDKIDCGLFKPSCGACLACANLGYIV